jgi:hypothetical protein|tara:strand:+ start:485 stop:637 length:153 start_codon:yes stop_codon:yes gene_type:complete
MNLLIILAVGVGIVFLDDSPKDLPTIIEEQLICKPLDVDSNMCDGWRTEE